MVLGVLTMYLPVLGVPLTTLGYYIMALGDEQEAGSQGEG